MNRTRVIFIVIIVAALAVVGVAALLRSMNSSSGSPLVAEQSGPIQVRVLTALPVYDWVNEAAKQFNAEQRTLDGNVIQVEVISTDGLAALGRFDRDEFGTLPPDADLQNLTAEQEQALEPGPRCLPDRRRIPGAADRTQPVCLGSVPEPGRRAHRAGG